MVTFLHHSLKYASAFKGFRLSHKNWFVKNNHSAHRDSRTCLYESKDLIDFLISSIINDLIILNILSLKCFYFYFWEGRETKLLFRR